MKDLNMPLLMNIEWQAANRPQFPGEPINQPCQPVDLGLILLKSATTANRDVNYEAIDVPVPAISGLQDRVFFNDADVTELAQRMTQCDRLDLANSGHMIPLGQFQPY